MAASLVVKPTDVSTATLEAVAAFKGLTSAEATYAKSLYDASWAGAKICLLQCSAESVPAFSLISLTFAPGFDAVKAAVARAGVSSDDWEAFAAWVASFVDSMGNYRSFGDTKLLPGLPVAAFEAIMKASPSYATYKAVMDELWSAVAGPIYDASPRLLQMGLHPEGISTFYSSNITKADCDLIDRWITASKLSQPYNSRVMKVEEGRYQFRWASALTDSSGDSDTADAPADLHLGSHCFEGVTIEVVRGDYAPLMARIVAALEAAKTHAANPTQVAMLGHYIRHFSTGSMEAHIDGSRAWVKDVGPVVESYLGFIESYRDPVGTRGEWEGLVAVVDKAQSAKFTSLVDAAPSLLSALPWGAAFEKDTFKRPDFTSLAVLAFGSSGIPAGINIPNYDIVRQNEGFKNVSLGNVLSARDIKERVTFLGEADQEAYRKLIGPAFEVQVGLHELLGHGSGKLFMEAPDGSLNFDPAAVRNPLTGGPISSWYKPGQTWDTVFGGVASTMEECRAEAVGIYLCVLPQVLQIFGHPPAGGTSSSDVSDLQYVNWLNMARAGLLALQFYTPATKTWGQAHMQARYALLQVMLRAGGGLVTLVGADGLTSEGVARGDAIEGQGGVHILLDRSKIMSVGVPAVGAWLKQLQVYKATADVSAAKEVYNDLTAVPDAWLPLRDLVIAKRKPRQMFVQPILEPLGATCSLPGSTVTVSPQQNEVQLRSFPPTTAGLIDAFVTRFGGGGLDAELLALWRAERHHHVYTRID